MKTLIIVTTLLASFNLLAQTYFLHPLTGKKKELLYAANQLLHASLQEKNLTMVKKPENAIFEFKGKVINLGSATVIQMNRVRDGKIMQTTKVKITKIENLDKAIDMIVKKLVSKDSKITKKTSKKVHRVGNIKKSEQDKYTNRFKSRDFKNISFGGATFVNGANTNVGYYFRYGTFWDVDSRMAIKLQFDMDISSKEPSAFFGMGSLGLNYYFSDTKFSPYIGADFGYATSIQVGVDDKAGFAIGASIGMMMFRTASTQIGVEARYQTVTNKNEKGLPGALSLSLGIFY